MGKKGFCAESELERLPELFPFDVFWVLVGVLPLLELLELARLLPLELPFVLPPVLLPLCCCAPETESVPSRGFELEQPTKPWAADASPLPSAALLNELNM